LDRAACPGFRFTQSGLRLLPTAAWNLHGCAPLPPLKNGNCTMSLLKWALIFFLVSIVAAVFGFTGISAATADIARILFYIFLVIFVVLLVLGVAAARRV
jgi:uncharacterized membrane protein YtjA (UPF0391 family)